MSDTIEQTLQASISDPSTFWAKAAEAIDWERRWDTVLDNSNAPFYRWFTGGRLNTCYNALDRHVEGGRADQVALIHDSPVTGTVSRFTYRELRDATAEFAGALRRQGVDHGDRVIIYMPMIPQAVIAMLACSRLGAVHSVVFGGFAANELAARIDDALPKVVIAATCGIEPKGVVCYKSLLDNALDLSIHKPDCCIVFSRPQIKTKLVAGRDIEWDEALAGVEPAECVSVSATDPLYILYTSGTTGQPKGVVRDNGGHAVALRWSMENIYGVKPGEVYWAASDIGWVVGHSYIVYAPLLSGNTTVLFEGKPVGTPDAGTFWRVVADHKVQVLFTAPTAIRAIKKEDPQGTCVEPYDLSGLRALFLAGERCDPDTLAWSERTLGVPVIDHWWQTETGWPMASNCLGIEQLPIKPGSPTRAVPGYDIRVLADDGKNVPTGQIGAIVVKLPMPPGTLTTFWQADQRYVDACLSQFDGFYLTGDAGFKDADDYLWIMSRIDDVINVAGHRLSTGAMEEVLTAHPDVAECAVIGVKDNLKGELPLGLVVLNSGVNRKDDELAGELTRLMREKIGPVAGFKLVAAVERLPKTRSGKIFRGIMKKIADGVQWKMPATIDDPAILDEISSALGSLGYPKISLVDRLKLPVKNSARGAGGSFNRPHAVNR
ncbi:MAG: propionyl-CoA synthetase [Verrucomicrobiales bacterium]|jgi:propionyl-CoA synthetase|nr:propionyl-CoA synthetase [Verrucomicrobiales bacterium]